MKSFLVLLALAIAILTAPAAAQCATTSFPTDNTNPPSTDFVTLTAMNGGVFGDLGGVTC